MKKQEDVIGNIVILTGIILIIILALPLFINSRIGGFEYVEPKIEVKDLTTEEKVANILNTTNFEYNSYELLGDKYLVLENSGQEVIYNLISDEKVDYTALFKEESQEKLESLIQNTVKEKYPEFISFPTLAAEVPRKYNVGNNISIEFLNVTTTPQYNDKINIVLTCSMIKDIIDYDCDASLENPDINKVHFDKTVAISFDDGPSKYTKDLLNTLKINKAHATFFVLGEKILAYSETIKEALADGNEIGGHSYSHKYLTKIYGSELDNEFYKTNEAYKSITGYDLKLFRPPYGSINSSVKEAYDFAFILWSVDSNDWRHKDVQANIGDVIDVVQDGDIILFHDTYFTTTEAIKIILPELYVRGFNVVTVSELANEKGKAIEMNTIYRSFK